jgi:hypothetical protein
MSYEKEENTEKMQCDDEKEKKRERGAVLLGWGGNAAAGERKKAISWTSEYFFLCLVVASLSKPTPTQGRCTRP